jgi:hypothetical protein
MTLTAGPYAEISITDDYKAPFYALRFDKDGRSQGPRTRQHLLESLPGDYTDVYVFCHGWNNDWGTALGRYQEFFSTFRTLVTDNQLDLGRSCRPILVGIFWPSTALVMPGERGPQFAGDEEVDPNEVDLPVIDELGGAVAEDKRDRYYDLLDRPALDEAESQELLEMLSSVFADGDEEVPGDEPRDVGDIRAAWAMYQAATDPPAKPGSATDFGAVGAQPQAPGQPHAAGLLDKLEPRKLVRLLTVYKMKDRAGVIGTNAVGPLLRDLLGKTTNETRFHLVGHSYGARVHLNAVSRPDGGPLPRPVESLLLLQPAVNHLCFAEKLDNGTPGGYRAALAMVNQPILTTFSHHDFPLHDTFHLSLRRGKDVGDIGIAGDEPPSKYAALGGYGPRGLTEWAEVDIKTCPDPYDLGDDAPEVWAVKGGDLIKGHGDVVSPATAWALFNLVRG